MQLRGAAVLAVITLRLTGCVPWSLIQRGPAPSPTSTGPSGKIPVTGQPSAQFCENAGAYLSKFPDVPLYRPDPEVTSGMGILSCWYTKDPPDALKGVSLEAETVKDDEDRAAHAGLCDDEKLGPGSTRITAGWVTDRGWSAWIAQHDPTFSEAVLCTPDQFYTVRVNDVPGATADDALATVLAAID